MKVKYPLIITAILGFLMLAHEPADCAEFRVMGNLVGESLATFKGSVTVQGQSTAYNYLLDVRNSGNTASLVVVTTSCKMGVLNTSPSNLIDVTGRGDAKIVRGGTSLCIYDDCRTGFPSDDGIGGSGTIGYLVKASGTSTFGNSILRYSGDNIGIGIAPTSKLHVSGSILISSGATQGSYYIGGKTDSGQSGVRLSHAASVGSLLDARTPGAQKLYFRADNSYGTTERVSIGVQTGRFGVGTGTATTTGTLTVQPDSTDTYSFYVSSQTATLPLFIVTRDGVGINTDTVSSTMTVEGTIAMPVTKLNSGGVTVTESHAIIIASGTSMTSYSITLPSSVAGRIYIFKRTVCNANYSIAAASGQYIDGSSYYYLTANTIKHLVIIGDGTNWHIIDGS